MPVRLSPEETLPILQVKVSDLAPLTLVAGDPARVERIAALLENPRRIGANREYVTYTGTYRGTPVNVCSHGVGSAGAGVAFEELCRAGVTRIVRVGTAGGLQPDVLDGSIVVATGAVRADGLSQRMVPLGFPAVADLDVTVALRAAAAKSGVDVHTGIVLTADNFYPSPVLENDQRMWQTVGVVAVEMEVATLLTVAAINGVQAGAVVAIDGNPLANEDESMAEYQPFRDVVDTAVNAAILAGLEALIS
ncbi:nucleoside phosphorylase [Glaciibacter psychrotolerans]|uniref:Uridine phosphorylase n=1 Tax=Glaciibacter psychrotolerans TaxID=670054 RepID=A0A7Z0J6U8_9MICO|nr:nucleoside phosphorylase [Leifsonia psychrotolerans]NYJ20780.1 uridine phosphorylase [Leifsonia psychrotolerans]